MTWTRRVRRRVVLATLALILLPPAGFLALGWWTSNFGVLEPGRVYRSGQMTAAELSRTVRARRSGRSSTSAASTRAGLVSGRAGGDAGRPGRRRSTSRCRRASGCRGPSCGRSSGCSTRASYPLLIHCQCGLGADGPGLGLRRRCSGPADARRRAGRSSRSATCSCALGTARSCPSTSTSTRPGSAAGAGPRPRRGSGAGSPRVTGPAVPSREQWPYDPYPLVVVTRPGRGGSAVADGLAPARPVDGPGHRARPRCPTSDEIASASATPRPTGWGCCTTPTTSSTSRWAGPSCSASGA